MDHRNHQGRISSANPNKWPMYHANSSNSRRPAPLCPPTPAEGNSCPPRPPARPPLPQPRTRPPPVTATPPTSPQQTTSTIDPPSLLVNLPLVNPVPLSVNPPMSDPVTPSAEYLSTRPRLPLPRSAPSLSNPLYYASPSPTPSLSLPAPTDTRAWILPRPPRPLQPPSGDSPTTGGRTGRAGRRDSAGLLARGWSRTGK